MIEQGPQTPPAEPMATPKARFVPPPGPAAAGSDPGGADLPEYEAVVVGLTEKLRDMGTLNEGLRAATEALNLARADLRSARGRLDTIAGELDGVAGETREATGALTSLNPDRIRQRLDEVERAMTAGLAGLAPLLTAAHDEATRAAEAATEAGRQAVAAANEAGQHAAAAAGETVRQTTVRIDAAEARLGERLDLAADRLATDLGDLLTDRFAGVGQALAAQEGRAQQGLAALQQGVAEQAATGREATERGLAALHERAAAGATADAVTDGFTSLHGRLDELPGRLDALGQKVDSTGAVADRAALTAQASEEAIRRQTASLEAAVGSAGARTAAALGGRLVALLVVQILTLALVAGLAYLVWQGR